MFIMTIIANDHNGNDMDDNSYDSDGHDDETGRGSTDRPTDPRNGQKTLMQRFSRRCSDSGYPVVVKGETKLEFGMYQGQTFRWALENATE
ncbi:hypothetical protein PoB_007309200 [Plakobranchus ocellatus]|uniref:Uncharacterized protein n=1 Tax=Plakobranchus ocellatus TaxID=259542 RepID=A0AAV4DQN5_9GAST|nr:hypothetical protein PoB_007309200 [Plakobranchus ocellatus]